VLTHTTDFMSGCDMDLRGVGKLPANKVQCQSHSELKQLCATDYMQMVMYTTGLVLKIPVQCSCS